MAATANIRRYTVIAVKVLASLIFIAIILRVVRAADIVNNFKTLNIPFLLALIPMAFLVIWISCVKWKLLLGARRDQVSVGYLMSLYLLGYFFSNFLPSMMGGDAARGYYLGRRVDAMKSAYLSVLLERLTGLFALIALVAVLALGNHPVVHNAGIRLSLMALTLSLTAAIIALFSKRFFALLLRLVPSRQSALRLKLERAHTALISFRQQPSEFALVMLLSLSFHLLAGVNLYLACRALNATPDLFGVILVTPLIMLISMIPISLNGAGLWEGSFIVFLALLGVPESVAVSTALLLRLKNLMMSTMGWFVYLGQREKPEQHIEID